MVSPSIATHGPVVCHPLWVFFGCLVIHSPPHRRPREWVYPCSTRRNEDKVSEPPWQRWAERYIVYIYIRVCVRAREGMHVHVQGSTFTTWAELRAQECWLVVVWWWRWAWGWHISANNHITHKDPHSNFLINSRRPPPPTGTALGAAVQQTVFRSRRAKILCFFYEDVYSKPYWLWVLLLETSLKLNTYIKAGKDWQLDRILE